MNNTPMHKMMHKNRKGFTYILVTSLLVIVLLGMFFSSNMYTHQDKAAVYKTRIIATNDFVKNLDQDIHRATYIAAFRALIALEDNVNTNGVYLVNMNESFRETFQHGTINGEGSAIMENSSLDDYLIRVSQIARDTGMVLCINVTSIKLSQSSPWSIDVNVLMEINISDNQGLASWNINNSYMTNIPVYNLRDPLYGHNTFNRVPNTIRTLNTTVLVNGTDTGNLQKLLNNSYYLASANAPNYLMRFEGLTGADPNGIESVVNIQALSGQDIPVYEDKVKIDYIYFNNITTDRICNIQNIPSAFYFIIPSNRKVLYQVNGLNSSVCS